MAKNDDSTRRINPANSANTRLIRDTRELDDDADFVPSAKSAKTRLVSGFNAKNEAAAGGDESSAPDEFDPVTGWLVIIDGPGRGNAVGIYVGNNTLGRGGDQRIQVDFGDTGISRETHAIITYDENGHGYFVRDSGRANVVRLNGKPVMQPMDLKNGDKISIGKTTFRFVPLCSKDFSW